MNRVMTLGRSLLASTVATTLLFAAACGSTPDMNYGGANTAATGRPTTSVYAGETFSAADVAFARMTVPHYQQAVHRPTAPILARRRWRRRSSRRRRPNWRRCRLSSTGPDPTGRSSARRAGPVKAGEMLGPTVHNGLLTT